MNEEVKTLMLKVLSEIIELNQNDNIECWYSLAGHVENLNVTVRVPLLCVRGFDVDFYYDKSLSDDEDSIFVLNDTINNINRIKREVEIKTSPEFLESEKAKKTELRKARLLKELKELEG